MRSTSATAPIAKRSPERRFASTFRHRFRVNIPAPAEHFVLLSGTPKTHIKTAESGNKRLHAFCGNRGTPIYACAMDNPQSYGLRIGAITQRAAFSPKRQGWRRSALHWVDALAAVPATEKGWPG
jgi:hypothetical protein